MTARVGVATAGRSVARGRVHAGSSAKWADSLRLPRSGLNYKWAHVESEHPSRGALALSLSRPASRSKQEDEQLGLFIAIVLKIAACFRSFCSS